MAISPVTVTFSLLDFLGYVPDVRRTKIILETNVDSGFLVDTTTGGSFRLTDARVTIDSTGLASFSVLPSGATGLNPSTYQIRVHIDAANPATKEREQVDLGWYSITAAANLKDLVATQYVPPLYLSTVTTLLDSKVAAAQTAQLGAEAAEDAAQALVLSDLSTSDGQLAAIDSNPASAYRVQSDARAAATYAPVTLTPQVVSGFVAPTFDALTTTSDVPVAILADGIMYGRNGANLKKSSDGGATWTLIRDLTGTPGELITIKDTTGGEVLIICAFQIYRTSGWAANKATATLTAVLAAPGTSSFYQWGVDTNPVTGTCTAATYVGTPPYTFARYVWVSVNGGTAWTVRYDVNDHAAEAGGTISDCHTHNAIIDPWAGDRIWITWHRASVLGSGRILYSDDKGLTWTRLDTSRAGSGSSQPTAAIALKNGVAFATDEQPNGVYVVTRTPDPADMVYKFAYRWTAPATGVSGFGQWSTRTPDGTIGYIAFSSDVGFKPILVQTDGITASLMLESAIVNASSLGDGYRTILYDNATKTLLAVDRRAGVYQTTRARRTLARTSQVTPALDPGWALGGTSWGIQSVALGRSTTSAARSLAAGDAATASSTDTVALGNATAAAGSGGTSVGASASASGTNSTAYGFGAVATIVSSTALGRAATSTGTNGTAVGDSASVTASNGTALGKSAVSGSASVAAGQGATAGASCVVIGVGANSTNDLSTIVGHGALGGGAYGTVVGQLALIAGTTQYGTALGRAANVSSGHTRSVALGSTTTTTAADQVQTGGRHFEFNEVTEPGAPAVDAVRLYAVDNGAGKTELRARFNGGKIVPLAIESGLTRLVPLTTASRPSAATVGAGAAYYDTTLSKAGFCDGTAWRDAAGTVI